MMALLQKMLIVKTTTLGDVMHNSPMITDIRAHFPNIQINWVEESYADVLKLQPHINRNTPEGIRYWRKFFALKWQSQSQQYNATINTQSLFKSGLI